MIEYIFDLGKTINIDQLDEVVRQTYSSDYDGCSINPTKKTITFHFFREVASREVLNNFIEQHQPVKKRLSQDDEERLKNKHSEAIALDEINLLTLAERVFLLEQTVYKERK